MLKSWVCLLPIAADLAIAQIHGAEPAAGRQVEQTLTLPDGQSIAYLRQLGSRVHHAGVIRVVQQTTGRPSIIPLDYAWKPTTPP